MAIEKWINANAPSTSEIAMRWDGVCVRVCGCVDVYVSFLSPPSSATVVEYAPCSASRGQLCTSWSFMAACFRDA